MAGATDGSCIPGQDPGSDICYRRITGLDPLARYDVNKNGVLDLGDWAMLSGAFDTTSFLELYDFNEDGAISKLEDGKLWVQACAVFKAQTGASITCPTLR